MAEVTVDAANNLVFELDTFDGPLDLLLYLIKKDEVDIYDIPVAEITRQYLAYLDACRELNLEVAGEFLYMASVLIRIKAQMLFPASDDGEQWEDPRTELVKALLEYRKIKNVSESLDVMAENRSKFHPRGIIMADIPRPEPELVRVDMTSLIIAFGDLMSRIKPVEAYDVERLRVTVEQRKDYILTVINKERSVEFDRLFIDDPRKIVMVVTFIALLELVKTGILRVEQAERFSTIRVYNVVSGTAVTTPEMR